LYVSEIVPPSLSGSLGSFNQMGTVSGFVMAFSIPFILPLPDEPDALTTDLWRVVFMGPAIISMVIITVFTFVFRYDTPLFYKKKGDMINYNKIMNLIYIDYQNDDNENDKIGEDIEDDGDREVRPSNEHLYSKEGEQEEEISSNAIIGKLKNSVLDTPLPNLGTAEPAIIDLNQNIKASENEESEEVEKAEGGEGDEEAEMPVKAENTEELEKAKTAKTAEIAKRAREAEIAEVVEKDEVSTPDKSGESGDVPVKSKEWPAHYKKGLFVCGMLSFMFQTTGIDAVIFFSSELFLDGKFYFLMITNHTSILNK
jgi:hypothetical protein